MSQPDHLRKAYHKGTLDQGDLTSGPMDLFRKWWHEAIDAEVDEANAMTLATADHQGQPSARTVLLKGLSEAGFEFFTNYLSRKAEDMASNPRVALLFYWKELERQIRIEGFVEKVSRERSEKYFQSRPRGSQVGGWVSPQSQVIPDRTVLDNIVAAVEAEFEGMDTLPLPEHWGGYLVRPQVIEFWQGRADRLHDRFRYSLTNTKDWLVERLAP